MLSEGCKLNKALSLQLNRLLATCATCSQLVVAGDVWLLLPSKWGGGAEMAGQDRTRQPPGWGANENVLSHLQSICFLALTQSGRRRRGRGDAGREVGDDAERSWQPGVRSRELQGQG